MKQLVAYAIFAGTALAQPTTSSPGSPLPVCLGAGTDPVVDGSGLTRARNYQCPPAITAGWRIGQAFLFFPDLRSLDNPTIRFSRPLPARKWTGSPDNLLEGDFRPGLPYLVVWMGDYHQVFPYLWLQALEIRFRDSTGKITSIGRASTLTLQAAEGINLIANAGESPGDILLTLSADTAVMLSQKRHQAEALPICHATSASGRSYRCTLTPFEESYPADQVLLFLPDVVSLADPTLDIEGLGPRFLRKRTAAGLENLGAGDLAPGDRYLVLGSPDYWLVVPLRWSA